MNDDAERGALYGFVAKLAAMRAANEDYWPREQYPGGAIRCAAPSQLRELTALLLARGRSETEVRAVLGGSFLRVAGEVRG